MTRGEAVTEIQTQLAFRTTLSSNIILHLQQAQRELEMAPSLPWFLESSTDLVTVADTQTIALPTDFLDEIDDGATIYTPDDVSADDPIITLYKDEYDVLAKAYMDTTTGILQTGAPEAYSLNGNNLTIFPTPDDVYTITFPYYAQDDLLTTDIENQWLKYIPLLLMGKAGKKIALGPLRDQVAYSVFDSWEKEGHGLLLSRMARREISNRNLQVGGRH